MDVRELLMIANMPASLRNLQEKAEGLGYQVQKTHCTRPKQHKHHKSYNEIWDAIGLVFGVVCLWMAGILLGGG